MYIVMCPAGAEGASYAMLTTLSNLSSSVAYALAAACAEIWNVSNSNLEDGKYEGMWKLTLLCAVVQILPLAFISLLPANNEEQVCIFSLPYVMYHSLHSKKKEQNQGEWDNFFFSCCLRVYFL